MRRLIWFGLASTLLVAGGSFWAIWWLTGGGTPSSASRREGEPPGGAAGLTDGSTPPAGAEAGDAPDAQGVGEAAGEAAPASAVAELPSPAAPERRPVETAAAWQPPPPLPAAPTTPEARAREALRRLVDPCRSLGRRGRTRPTVLLVALQPEDGRMRVLSAAQRVRGDANEAAVQCALQALAGQVVEAEGARPGRTVSISLPFAM